MVSQYLYLIIAKCIVMKFKQEDIGRLVLLSVDPEWGPIAKALGASEVELIGVVVEVAEDYVVIQKRRYKHDSIKHMPYSQIKDYEFLPYVRNTSKVAPRIKNIKK